MRRGDYYPALETLFMSLITKYDFMSVVMYPELRNRREFVHDCYLIAKGTDNMDLKIAISEDKYFYLARDDLLELLKTNDETMITQVLEAECYLQLKSEAGYMLIAIKHA